MLELEECWRWVADELYSIIVTVSQSRIQIITLHTEPGYPGHLWSLVRQMVRPGL